MNDSDKAEHSEMLKLNACEKCEYHGSEACRGCLTVQKGLCLQRLVASFASSASLHPHSPTELGDLSFELTANGNKVNFIGLAKAPDLPITLKSDVGKDLFTQFYHTIKDYRTLNIAVITSAELDTGLRETLVNLARSEGKSILIIALSDLIRLNSAYLASLEKIEPTVYWVVKKENA